MEKINVDNIFFDNVTLDEAIAFSEQSILDNKQIAVFTPNPEMCQLCYNEPSLLEVYNSAELTLPDGIGIIKAANILGTPLKEKVAGVEFGTIQSIIPGSICETAESARSYMTLLGRETAPVSRK